MEKTSELEVKYQKLATEYAKIRSQVTVLKKAVLDEQAKNVEFKETIKRQEQQLRKHDQEMESLMFRNEQLTKRIAVLQSDLQNINKKGKNKNDSIPFTLPPSNSILDEELQKKIFENAQLVSRLADKDRELDESKEELYLLKQDIELANIKLNDAQKKHREEIGNILSERDQILQSNQLKGNELKVCDDKVQDDKTVKYWQEEAEKWKSECQFLKSKPVNDEELTHYYESQITELLNKKQTCLGETKSLWAENAALTARLENLQVEHSHLNRELEKSKEEINTVNQNYKLQLDAMTEHIAAQNDKITKQSTSFMLCN